VPSLLFLLHYIKDSECQIIFSVFACNYSAIKHALSLPWVYRRACPEFTEGACRSVYPEQGGVNSQFKMWNHISRNGRSAR